MQDHVGIIAIGRNEGERLRGCLASVIDCAARVYVDSGSTDGSQAYAVGCGVDLVELNVPPGFTAARARNEGFAMLRSKYPHLGYVQMIDGDCELDRGWLETAGRYLDDNPEVAVVFGRRRERFPDATIYNRMCDLEWDVPIGEAGSCGGDALFRIAALAQAGGYAPDMIAGEEPDLCLRMRLAGWRVRRIDAEMTAHDAALASFSQWWKRARRSGHAFAELAYRHWRRGGSSWLRQLASIAVWSLVVTAAVVGPVVSLVRPGPLLVSVSVACVLLTLIQVLRLRADARGRGADGTFAVRWAWLILIGKVAEFLGALQFAGRLLTRTAPRLIEYKGR